MLKTMNINELEERIKRDDESKYDFRVRAKDLFIKNEGTLARKQYPTKLGLRFSQHSFTQLLNRYNIPVRETKKSLEYDRYSVYDLINEMLDSDDSEILIRARVINNEGIIRSILSEEYSILNNSQIVNTVKENLENSRLDYNIETGYIDDNRLHLRITLDPTTQAFGKDIVGTDDIIKSGIDIINSETGRSSFRMEPLIFREVCKNGLKAWVGDENNERVAQRHIFISTKELNDLVREGIEGSLETAQNVLNNFENTKKIVVNDPVKEIKRLCEEQKYSKKLTNRVVRAYGIEPVKSRYGIINAFTRGARDISNTQKLDVETFAGRLMTDEKLFEVA